MIFATFFTIEHGMFFSFFEGIFAMVTSYYAAPICLIRNRICNKIVSDNW